MCQIVIFKNQVVVIDFKPVVNKSSNVNGDLARIINGAS